MLEPRLVFLAFGQLGFHLLKLRLQCLALLPIVSQLAFQRHDECVLEEFVFDWFPLVHPLDLPCLRVHLLGQLRDKLLQLGVLRAQLHGFVC